MEDSPPQGPAKRPTRLPLGTWSDHESLWLGIALVGPIVVALPLWLGLPSLSLLGVAIVAALGLRLRNKGSAGRLVPTIHMVYLLGLVAITYAVFALELPSVITVFFSAVILLHAAHLLGVRAALLWTIPYLMLIAAGVFAAPETVRPVSPPVVLTVRTATILTIVAFAVASRRAYDRQAEELTKLATTDSLTGLANRHELERALEDAVTRAGRHDRRCAVIFIDLDGLKAINDKLGHSAGDAVLRATAERISAHVRRTDTAARMGGDEFVLLLSEIVDWESAESVARKILDALEAPFVQGGKSTAWSASLGVAVFPDSAPDSAALLGLADTAMYEAKRAGGGRAFFHDGVTLHEDGAPTGG